MAYLYRKNRSPFWYVVYFDGDQKERHRSTGRRADDPNDTAKAKTLRAELEAKEYHRAPLINGAGWDAWAPAYLERHCQSARTLERYLDAWKWLALWLQLRRYHSPTSITYRNALEYVDWRISYKKKTGKTVGRNTAILELRILAILLT
jgi:hypothetical protein